MVKKFLAAAAVASLSISPALAAPTSPAASLSVAKNVRASTATSKQSALNGGGSFGYVGLAILAGIVAIGVIAIVNGDDDSDSN